MTASDLAPQTAQGARQASASAVTATAETYEGDWHHLYRNRGPHGERHCL